MRGHARQSQQCSALHGNVCGVTRKLPWREVRPLNHVLYHIQGLSSALQGMRVFVGVICITSITVWQRPLTSAQPKEVLGCARRTGMRCTCASSTSAASTARRRATTPPPAASAPGPPCRPMTGTHSDSSGPGCQRMGCFPHMWALLAVLPYQQACSFSLPGHPMCRCRSLS